MTEKDHENWAFTTMISAIVLGVVIVFIAFIIWFHSWGKGLREVRIQKERIKAESCYTEYKWSDAHKVNIVSLTYCPNQNQE